MRILEAAVGEVVDAGPTALTVGAVAERAGVSLRTVDNYFPDKDALTDAIVAARNSNPNPTSTSSPR